MTSWLLAGAALSPLSRQSSAQSAFSRHQLRLLASAWIAPHRPLRRPSRVQSRASTRAFALRPPGVVARVGQLFSGNSTSPPLSTTASLTDGERCTLGWPERTEAPSLSVSLTEDWRSAPELSATIDFPAAVVPQNAIHRLIRDPDVQPFLASALWAEMSHVQRRLRIVQEVGSSGPSGESEDEASSSKLLLLHPNVASDPAVRQKWQSAFQLVASRHSELSTSAAPVYGPSVSVQLRPKDFTVSHVLSILLPAELGTPPSSFETVGHVAHLNLPESFMPHRYLIGEVLLECLSSSLIRTVICKTDSVAGPYRTYDFEIVAGDPSTVVRHVEHGVNLTFDVQKVYWSSRLSQERKRLVAAFRPGQVIADAFCGVGALCLQASKLGCVVLANDWNPDAIESLQQNARRNRAKLSEVRCGDAYDFLMDLGLRSKGAGLPDHVVMNYPLEAPRFLGALRWWPPSAANHDSGTTGGGTRLHVYTFARAEGNVTAEDAAVEAIASHLVFGSTPNAKGTRLSRAAELDDYGCKIQVQFVRDVAPGKKVFCVSFTATPKLLRYMQGDFS